MPSSRQKPFVVQHRAQAGRVQAIVAGSLVMIAALWVSAGAVMQPAESAAVAAALTEADAQHQMMRQRASAAIEELRVTAPRIAMPQFSFEQPNSEVALSAPAAPKDYWTGNTGS